MHMNMSIEALLTVVKGIAHMELDEQYGFGSLSSNNPPLQLERLMASWSWSKMLGDKQFKTSPIVFCPLKMFGKNLAKHLVGARKVQKYFGENAEARKKFYEHLDTMTEQYAMHCGEK